MHVVCNGSDIEPDVEVTYLGVNLDQSLSGSSIVNKIVTKCNNKIKFLYRNARSFDPQTKGMLASALVQCHFDYACSMWFSCVSSTSRKDCRLFKTSLSDLFWAFQPVVILATGSLVLATCCLWNIELPN